MFNRKGVPKNAAPFLRPAILAPSTVALGAALIAGTLALQKLDAIRLQGLSSEFTVQASEMAIKIDERLKASRQVLQGAVGLMLASDAVSREEWARYVSNLDLNDNYPGIQGVGFAISLQPEQIHEHEKTMQAAGFTDYQIRPAGKRDEYTSIIYLEPFDWRNQRAFGFDMYSEPVRRAAMEMARTLKEPVLSGKVRLLQETDQAAQHGVLLYLPVLRPDAQGQEHFQGWAYSPLRMGDLIRGTLGEAPSQIRLQIYDGTSANEEALLYDSQPGLERADRFRFLRTLHLNHRDWHLVFSAGNDFHGPGMFTGFVIEPIAVTLIGALFVLLTASTAAARLRAQELADTGNSLRASEARYSTLVNLSHDGIAALDADLRFTFVNPRLAGMLGHDPATLLGKPLAWLWLTPDHHDSTALLARLHEGEAATWEMDLRRADGKLLTVYISDAPQRDVKGQLQGVILSITDITERKEAERQIHYLATHDSLTGLNNRRSFVQHLTERLQLARRQGRGLALLFIDLDHFKEVNDTHGHAIGDALLISAAQRMRDCLRASDLLGRQGGDEFMALLQDVESPEHALQVADKLREALSAPYLLAGQACRISASIGIAVYPLHGEDGETLTTQADRAMYEAKRNGRNRVSGAPTPSAS